METRGIIRYWFLLGVLAVLSIFIIPLVKREASQAQTPASESNSTRAGREQTNTVQQEKIPADHYDPDDTKTYEDVITEDRAVLVRGQQFNIHFYRPRTEG